MNDPLNIMTGLHRKLIHILEKAGFELLEEVSFPPAQVDIYIPLYHIAFEADGPYHKIQQKHDRIRDQKLLDTYKLPVCRFTQEEIEHDVIGVRTRAVIFAKSHLDTTKERLRVAHEEAPWI